MPKELRLQASNADRWMACPPSEMLVASVLEARKEYSSYYPAGPPSPAMSDGVRAHAVAAAKVKHGAGMMSDAEYEKKMSKYPDLDPGIDRATTTYADYVLGIYSAARNACEDAELYVEKAVDFSDWVPRCGGKCDALVISDKVMDVFDYKHGIDSTVSAEGNPQLRLYGLGGLKLSSEKYIVPYVRMHIVQPRVHTPVYELLTRDELLLWGDTVAKPRADQALRGAGDFCPGPVQCRHCQANALCLARAEEAFRVFQMGFKKPYLLSDEQLMAINRQADMAIAYLSDVKKFCSTRDIGRQEALSIN